MRELLAHRPNTRHPTPQSRLLQYERKRVITTLPSKTQKSFPGSARSVVRRLGNHRTCSPAASLCGLVASYSNRVYSLNGSETTRARLTSTPRLTVERTRFRHQTLSSSSITSRPSCCQSWNAGSSSM